MFRKRFDNLLITCFKASHIYSAYIILCTVLYYTIICILYCKNFRHTQKLLYLYFDSLFQLFKMKPFIFLSTFGHDGVTFIYT